MIGSNLNVWVQNAHSGLDGKTVTCQCLFRLRSRGRLDFWEITAAQFASSMQMLPGSTADTYHASAAEALGGFHTFFPREGGHRQWMQAP